MSSAATAEIIAFPTRHPVSTPNPVSTTQAAPVAVQPPSAIPTAAESQVRLAKALKSLDAALTEQRIAIAAWREALGQLRESVNSLGTSVKNYRGALDSLNTKVVTLGGEARRLESWADDAIVHAKTADANAAS